MGPEGQFENGLVEARDQLLEAIKLRAEGNSQDDFFLAMSRWKLGEQEQAKEDYSAGVTWMEQRRPGNEKLRRLRKEVEDTLQIDRTDASGSIK